MSKLVKITLTASLAGAECIPAGSVIETTAKEAASLVAAGYATYDVAEEDAESKGFQARQTTAKKKRRR